MDLKVENTITAKVYNELRNSIGWDSKAEELVNEAIKNSAVVKLIKYDNKAVGMARAIGDGLYYLVVDVVVNKEYQGKGIGRKLYQYAVKQNNKGYFTVNSSPYAHEVYKHLGFEDTDEKQSVNGLIFYPMKNDKIKEMLLNEL